jgi:DNA-directed RNA polymerase subunit beta
VKDTSLKVPSGTYGIVMDVKVSAKKEARRRSRAPPRRSRHAKQVEEDTRRRWTSCASS